MKNQKYFFKLYKTLLLFSSLFFSFAAFSANVIFVNKGTGRCLDSNGSSIYTSTCNSTDFQKWTVQSDGSIKSYVANRPCIDSTKEGNIYPYSCNGSLTQQWDFESGGRIRNRATRWYLDSASASVYSLPGNLNAFQSWVQTAVTTPPIDQPTPVQVQPTPVQVNDTPNLYVSNPDGSGFYGVKIYRGEYNDQLSIGPYGTNFADGAAKEGYFGAGQFEPNAISSIKMSAGFQVELFENADFTGKIYSFRGNRSFKNEYFDKFAKSMRIWQPKSDSVSVYQDSNYSGKILQFAIGDFPSLRSFDMNDQISSLQIPKGWIVVLYEHSNFQGKSKVFNSSADFVGSDFNDVASSMRIIENLTIGDWGDFKASCQYAGNGQSFVRYEARLWNLGSEWDEACKNKGAWLNGQWLQRPAACDKDNFRPAITTILSVAGVFTPFLSGSALVSGAAASVASQTASVVTVAKDNVPIYASSIPTGIWGSFLVRDEKQCNVLYQKYSASCLGAYNTGSVFFTYCEDSPQAKVGRSQFIRDGENFSFYSIDRSTGGLSRDCLHGDLSNNVSVKACDGSNYQNWQLIDAPDGAAKYKNRQTGMCLDGNGAQVYTHECNDTNVYQQWR